MEALLAATPVLSVVVLMVGLTWTAVRAGAVTALFTVTLAITAGSAARRCQEAGDGPGTAVHPVQVLDDPMA